jgi:hypothetical protein
MAGSHTPLSVSFWSAYLMSSQTPGVSAVQLQRQLGLSRYETAFQILHKLRAGVRPRWLAIVPDRSAESLCSFVECAVVPGTSLVTDDWSGYASLAKRGYHRRNAQFRPRRRQWQCR